MRTTILFLFAASSVLAQALTWIPHPTNGMEYARGSALMTWHQARTEAQAHGADLVIIDDASEDAWLYQSVCIHEPGDALWIGLTDEVNEGAWIWITGSPLTYSHWAPGEPNNCCGAQVDYGQIYTQMSNGYNSMWDDTSINVHRRGLYERPVFSPPCPLPSNSCLSLDGQDDYVLVSPPLSGLNNVTQFTVETWARRTAPPPCGSNKILVVGTDWNPTYGGVYNQWTLACAQVAVETGSGGPCAGQGAFFWPNVWIDQQWHHVAAVNDGNTLTCYLDGAAIQTVQLTSCNAIAWNQNGFPIRIGRQAANADYWPGEIDEVRIWSVARAEAQINATMFHEVDNLPGLVSVWHFNGNALDSTGSNHGTLQGGAGFATSPQSPVAAISSALLSANVPVPLGGGFDICLLSPSALAPLYVLVDVAKGSWPLGALGTTQLAFSSAMVPLADYTGAFGGGVTIPFTSGSGSWSWTTPVPNDPALLSLTLYSEAYVLDAYAPNYSFYQSNLLTISFQ